MQRLGEASEPKRTVVTWRVRQAIVQLYRSGRTSREVAEECDVAKSTVLRVLRREGVEVRERGVRY